MLKNEEEGNEQEKIVTNTLICWVLSLSLYILVEWDGHGPHLTKTLKRRQSATR